MRSNQYPESTGILVMVEKPEIGATLRYFNCPHCGARWIAEQSQYKFEEPIKFFNSSDAEVEVITRVSCLCPYCKYETINSTTMSRKQMLETVERLTEEEV